MALVAQQGDLSSRGKFTVPFLLFSKSELGPYKPSLSLMQVLLRSMHKKQPAVLSIASIMRHVYAVNSMAPPTPLDSELWTLFEEPY